VVVRERARSQNQQHQHAADTEMQNKIPSSAICHRREIRHCVCAHEKSDFLSRILRTLIKAEHLQEFSPEKLLVDMLATLAIGLDCFEVICRQVLFISKGALKNILMRAT